MSEQPALIWAYVAILIVAVSIFYKRNILFVCLENLVVGSTIGTLVSQQLRAVYSSMYIPLQRADYSVVFPLLIGLCYLFVLTRNPVARWILRFVVLIQAVQALGQVIPTNFYGLYVISLGYTQGISTDVNKVITLIMYICAITYFIFGTKLSRYTRITRTAGAYVLYAFCGMMVGLDVFLFNDNLIGMSYGMVRSPAMILWIVPIAWILIDQRRQGWSGVKTLARISTK